jgi:hypothetical protein
MAEDKKDISGVVENIAFATDKLQNAYPKGKIAIIVELDNKSYIENQFNFDMFNQNVDQFKIDISDVEVIFIRENTIQKQPEEVVEKPKEKNLLKKLSEIIFSKKSS